MCVEEYIACMTILKLKLQKEINILYYAQDDSIPSMHAV